MKPPPFAHSIAKENHKPPMPGDGRPKTNVNTRHNYEYVLNAEAQTAPAKVVRIAGSNKRVLEIGAGPGSITRILQKNGCRVTGVEIDPTAIEKLSEFCEEVHRCDLNDPQWTSALAGCGAFDVIVAADVFEHLYWPQKCLQALKPFLSPGGYLVVSLPYVGNSAVIASIMDDDFEYRDSGLLDKTHIRFFGLKNMQDLFEQAGYKIVAAEFVVNPPEQTELAPHWKKLAPEVKHAISTRKFGTVYQVVIKAVPDDFPGTGLRLADLPVPDYAATFRASAIAWLRPYLSPKLRTFIKSMLPKFLFKRQ